MRKISGLSLFIVLLLSAGSAEAQQTKRLASDPNWCRSDSPPKIEIKTSTDQVSWDFSKSEKQLNSFNIDTVNPYGKSVITDVGGLMQGGIYLQEGWRFGMLTNTTLGQICYWYDTLTITLHIRPTIFIASEFPQGTCKHNAIREHELKHIQVDREIVNKYAKIIGQALKDDIDKQSVFGPYHVSQSKEVEGFLKARVENVLKYYSALMDDERKRRQQLIDSLAEYERVNRLCR